jgi:hypothetical protein
MKAHGTRSQLEEQVKALEQLEGYPKAPAFVGAVCASIVPKTFSPGAPGWSEKLAEIRDIDPADGGGAECVLPDDVVERHRGKSVTVNGRSVTIDPKERAGNGGGAAPGKAR